jgi:hypothetical protein
VRKQMDLVQRRHRLARLLGCQIKCASDDCHLRVTYFPLSACLCRSSQIVRWCAWSDACGHLVGCQVATHAALCTVDVHKCLELSLPEERLCMGKERGMYQHTSRT